MSFTMSNLFVPPLDLNAFISTKAQWIAKILRAEEQPLSSQEVEDALAAKMSFGLDDMTIVDWNAALIVDREGDDIRAVLEFANVELLEMRYLDQKLDRALDRAYEALSRRSWIYCESSDTIAPICAGSPSYR